MRRAIIRGLCYGILGWLAWLCWQDHRVIVYAVVGFVVAELLLVEGQ